PRVFLRVLAPKCPARVFVQEPEDPRIEPFAPVSPALTFSIPQATNRVHRHVTGMFGDEPTALLGGECDSLLVSCGHEWESNEIGEEREVASLLGCPQGVPRHRDLL